MNSTISNKVLVSILSGMMTATAEYMPDDVSEALRDYIGELNGTVRNPIGRDAARTWCVNVCDGSLEYIAANPNVGHIINTEGNRMALVSLRAFLSSGYTHAA